MKIAQTSYCLGLFLLASLTVVAYGSDPSNLLGRLGVPETTTRPSPISFIEQLNLESTIHHQQILVNGDDNRLPGYYATPSQAILSHADNQLSSTPRDVDDEKDRLLNAIYAEEQGMTPSSSNDLASPSTHESTYFYRTVIAERLGVDVKQVISRLRDGELPSNPATQAKLKASVYNSGAELRNSKLRTFTERQRNRVTLTSTSSPVLSPLDGFAQYLVTLKPPVAPALISQINQVLAPYVIDTSRYIPYNTFILTAPPRITLCGLRVLYPSLDARTCSTVSPIESVLTKVPGVVSVRPISPAHKVSDTLMTRAEMLDSLDAWDSVSDQSTLDAATYPHLSLGNVAIDELRMLANQPVQLKAYPLDGTSLDSTPSSLPHDLRGPAGLYRIAEALRQAMHRDSVCQGSTVSTPIHDYLVSQASSTALKADHPTDNIESAAANLSPLSSKIRYVTISVPSVHAPSCVSWLAHRSDIEWVDVKRRFVPTNERGSKLLQDSIYYNNTGIWDHGLTGKGEVRHNMIASSLLLSICLP